MKDKLQPAIDLADSIVRQFKPEMRWMWGEALLGYALSELDAYLGTNKYESFLKGYCDHYVKHSPRVDQADTSAPALITYAMQKKTGNDNYRKLTGRVLDYIKNEPRLIDDAVNHLGNSPEGRFYPKSIWVDSLMMFGVFTARYASEKNDEKLMDFASRQPRQYSSRMQDEKTGLWSHSYWAKSKRAYPKDIFWARGNGWVIASLPMILSFLPEDHPEREGIIRIFKSTSAALIEYQREDGYFNTVLNHEKKTYREASATALIAAGWYEGVSRGWLDDSYSARAERAYQSLCSSLIRKGGELYLPEISGPTIPLPLLPYLGYKFIPRRSNWAYGVAAFIFAGIAAAKHG
jgi:unsaturated rhamnogalacturonyl hydrolase